MEAAHSCHHCRKALTRDSGWAMEQHWDDTWRYFCDNKDCRETERYREFVFNQKEAEIAWLNYRPQLVSFEDAPLPRRERPYVPVPECFLDGNERRSMITLHDDWGRYFVRVGDSGKARVRHVEIYGLQGKEAIDFLFQVNK